MLGLIINPARDYYKLNDQVKNLEPLQVFGEYWEATESQVVFQDSLKVGDEVDALKID